MSILHSNHHCLFVSIYFHAMYTFYLWPKKNFPKLKYHFTFERYYFLAIFPEARMKMYDTQLVAVIKQLCTLIVQLNF